MKLKFTREHITKNKAARKFEEGKSYELPEATARHFLNMGVAVVCDGKKAKPKAKAGKAESEAEVEAEDSDDERTDISARTDRQVPEAMTRKDLLGK